MPLNDALTPQESSFIATNAYFTLKDWLKGTPSAGLEQHDKLRNAVLGGGNPTKPGTPNTSLKGTGLGKSELQKAFSGTTGMGTSSGFGYVLTFKKGDRRHVVIATRGTRPELGAPDLLTDLRAGMAGFGDYGPVHKGFRKTFDSVVANLADEHKTIMDADIVHCVGHSLGGGVATLVAAHYVRLGKAVKLYTYGCPRVGAFETYAALEAGIKAENIYRTSHDLDPVTLIATYPYIHVLPKPRATNNFTLVSPTGALFSTANHDMAQYIRSVARSPRDTWETVRGRAQQVDHDNAVLAKWLLHEDNNPGWVQYASAKTLGILFKLFAHVLKGISTAVIMGLTATDLLAEMLHKGLARTAALAQQVFTLLRHAAAWAGIKVNAGANFTAQIIQRILDAMMARLTSMAAHSLNTVGHHIDPIPLIIAGGWALSAGSAF